MLKRVGILINGGDAPGLNAVIRAIVRTAEKNQVECYGFLDGFNGILNNNFVILDHQLITSGILHKGGAIIGSSLNSNVFNYKVVEEDGSVVYKDLSEKCVQNLKEDGIDCLFTLQRQILFKRGPFKMNYMKLEKNSKKFIKFF